MCAITPEKILGLKIIQTTTKAKDYGAFIVELLNNNPEILENPNDYLFI